MDKVLAITQTNIGQTNMGILKILRYAVFSLATIISLCGCFYDSIEPWLQSDSIRKSELVLEGSWTLINDDFKDKYIIKLKKKKDQRSIDQQSYYIGISPRKYSTRFNFIGVVHEINNIKLVQITNFTHYHDDIFSLANRPTVSLWQIAYDEENIIIWAPSFPRESASTLKTIQDSNNKNLFIDTTENLQNYINDWTKDYPKIKNSIRMIMPIILTRTGTEFKMPKEMQDLVPRVYERLLSNPGNKALSPVEDQKN